LAGARAAPRLTAAFPVAARPQGPATGPAAGGL